jgi:hypothetical protein
VNRVGAAVLVTAAFGCLAGCPGEGPPITPACGTLTIQAATAPDRRLLGAASDYPADGMLASHMDELLVSQRARRAAAWEVIRRTVEPVALAEPMLPTGTTLPRFRTWYDRDDVTRIFETAYEGLGADGRAARARFSEAQLDAAFDANLHVLDSLPEWTDTRWAEYVASFDGDLRIAGSPGLRRIAISPTAARHVARSYPEIVQCLRVLTPGPDGMQAVLPAIVDGAAAPQHLAQEALMLEACGAQIAGPYYVATGATIEAHVEGDGAADATLRLLGGDTLPLAEERCTDAANVGCDASGPGAFYVEVTAGGRALDARLDVTYAAPDVDFAPCLDGLFPLASATVAQQWQRVELGPMPTFDTSGAALTAHLAEGADATWGEGDGTADPGPDEIYTMRVPSGGTFRLAGMHIRTRELDHWVNITMWWSDRPDETFGADRPDTLTGPWAHYAMCVAIDDVERDPDPTGGFAETEPTLAEALAAVRGEPASWCSNPYIDAAPGLVRSNCVGCHQHALTGVHPGDVVMDETHFPLNGRVFVRNNFPADQFWGLDAGDDLARVLSDTVDYWDAAASP